MKKIICIFLTIISNGLLGQTALQEFDNLSRNYEKADYTTCLQSETTLLNAIPSLPDTLSYQIYGMLGESHFYQGDTEKALERFEQERSARLKFERYTSDEFIYCLQNIAYAYQLLGNNTKALEAANEMIVASQKIHNDDARYGAELFYTDLELKTGKLQEGKQSAEKYFKHAKRQSKYRALLQHKLGEANRLLGEYSQAEKNLKQSIHDIKQLVPFDSLEYGRAISNLGILYLNTGDYPEAESAFAEATSILKNGSDQEAYFATLNNHALALSGLYLNDEAAAIYKKILAFDEENYGIDHPNYGLSLTNLGLTRSNQEKYNEAISLFKQALKIDSATYGTNSYDYAISLNNLARAYRQSGQPERSIPLLEKSAEIYRSEVGAESPDYASLLINLGISYAMTTPDRAIGPLEDALKIRNKKLPKIHPKIAESTEWLARYYWMTNNQKKTAEHFNLTFDNFYKQIDLYFPFLSEAEKTKFYYTKLKPSFERYYNFVLANHKSDPSLTSTMYNHQLNTKALVMYATAKVRNNIYQSGDSILIRQYENFIDLKEQIAKLLSQNLDQDAHTIDSLNASANELEKTLTTKSAAFAKTYKQRRFTWQDVQSKLKPGEAAIEIVRFAGYDPDKGGQFNKKINYVALVVRRDSKNPELIQLTDGAQLEGRYMNYYGNAIKNMVRDTISYRAFYKPLSLKLGGVKKIYFSPDGVYNQINLNTLLNPASNKFLLDELLIQRLTNTRDLAATASTHQKGKGRAVLYGFPTYNTEGKIKLDTTQVEQRSLSRGLDRGVRSGILRYMRGEDGIPMLPGTKTEIEAIKSLMQNKSLTTDVKLSLDADEESLKKISSPQVLHIATHGFFLSNIQGDHQDRYLQNPLLRSGLILARAGDFLLSGELNGNTEQDGILTSFEAMNMNLEGTELVALSACETALGSNTNGEGIYGLQRAFQIAGAKTIIMSLWSVDDEATQLLMQNFYEFWLSSGDKKQAFAKAQKKLMTRFPHPFYWGAFVMLGE